MATRGVLAEGASIVRPPAFDGANYTFWKIRMRIFIEAQDLDLWTVVENGPHVPCTVINGEKIAKPREQWTAEDKRLVQLDFRVKNILTSALSCDEFFRVSNCKTSKEMWDTLEISHEGTEEVKRSRLNTLCQKYEMFRMQPHENIADMQKRFIHLINSLMSLGKTYPEEELNLKVLRSLGREWQPKVTAIAEKKSLSTMSLAAIFGKLQEHELELKRLDDNEFQDNPSPSKVALKTTKYAESSSSSSSSSTSSSSDEDQNKDLIQKFKEFMKIRKDKKTKKKEASPSSVECYKCKKKGHYANECPRLNKKKKNDSKKQKQRAHIAWESSSDSSFTSKNEHCQFALLAKVETESSSDSEEVNSSNSSASTDIHTAFEELYEKCIDLQKENSKLKTDFKKLQAEKDQISNEFEFLKIQYEFLEDLKPATHVLKKKKTRTATCTYCMHSGHFRAVCHFRNNAALCGKFKWVKKGSTCSTNVAGPKETWVPRSLLL